jgi:hypothetical protein
MNYDKQRPLTKKEIDYIDSIKTIRLIEMSTYPKGYIHVEILWNLPINITRNKDEFWFGENLKESNKENYWVVCSSDRAESDFTFRAEQFKNIKQALKYGISEYKKWLKKRNAEIKQIDLP